MRLAIIARDTFVIQCRSLRIAKKAIPEIKGKNVSV